MVFFYIIFLKEGDRLSEKINRLMACGFTEKNAEEIYYKYAFRGDWKALEDFIRGCELLYNDHKQYPKEEDY